VFTLAKRFDDEGEVEDSAEVFESPEEPLDFVALLVESAAVLPRLDAVGLWRNDRDHAQAEHQLPGFVTFVGAIHQQRQPFRYAPERPTTGKGRFARHPPRTRNLESLVSTLFGECLGDFATSEKSNHLPVDESPQNRHDLLTASNQRVRYRTILPPLFRMILQVHNFLQFVALL
jgi:hypothetical protein